MKIKILIALSILTLLSLIGIQGFLIYNSYELKQKTITIDARNAIAKIYTSSTVDSIAWLYRNDFLNQLDRYKRQEITKVEMLSKLQAKANEINPSFLSYYNEGLQTYGEDFDIQFKNIVTEISITDTTGVVEVLYPEQSVDRILLLGEHFSDDEGILINNSTWQDDHEVDFGTVSKPFALRFKSSIFMNVTNWNGLIAKELALILLLSCVLFFFVVGLLYYSIQNLLKQKRVAEIKTDFINNITHELKTPLSTLSLATNTLTSENDGISAEMKQEAVGVIDRQNARLQNLIDQVLKSSLGYKEIHLSLEPFQAGVFLKELLNDYKLSLDSAISIEQSIDHTGVPILADRFYLSTAIINLLNNAVKYGGTELLVSYSINTEENMHLISVQDNGIGIAPKYQKYIFEKFYRISEKDKHNYKGLGLGLYYTSQIIKAHDGTIQVSSEANKGSIFTFKIPVTS